MRKIINEGLRLFEKVEIIIRPDCWKIQEGRQMRRKDRVEK